MDVSSMPKKYSNLFLVILVLICPACSILNTGDTEDLEARVSALETRMANTAEPVTNSSAPDTDISTESEINAPLPPAESNQAQSISSTPIAETLPTSPVEAGIPVIFDGWALTLSQEIDAGNWNDEDQFELKFTIRNLGDQSRVFRFIKSGISVRDDLGNQYEFLMTSWDCSQAPDDIHLTQQLTIEAGEIAEIRGDAGYGCNGENNLPSFKGAIPIDANQLIVTVNDWGPYSNIEFTLDL